MNVHAQNFDGYIEYGSRFLSDVAFCQRQRAFSLLYSRGSALWDDSALDAARSCRTTFCTCANHI